MSLPYTCKGRDHSFFYFQVSIEWPEFRMSFKGPHSFMVSPWPSVVDVGWVVMLKEVIFYLEIILYWSYNDLDIDDFFKSSTVFYFLNKLMITNIMKCLMII